MRVNLHRWTQSGSETGSHVKTEAIPVQSAHLHWPGERTALLLLLLLFLFFFFFCFYKEGFWPFYISSTTALFKQERKQKCKISGFLSLIMLVLLPVCFPLTDVQRNRCWESKPGYKPGRAAGLGNLHAQDRTGWTLWYASNNMEQSLWIIEEVWMDY